MIEINLLPWREQQAANYSRTYYRKILQIVIITTVFLALHVALNKFENSVSVQNQQSKNSVVIPEDNAHSLQSLVNGVEQKNQRFFVVLQKFEQAGFYDIQLSAVLIEDHKITLKGNAKSLQKIANWSALFSKNDFAKVTIQKNMHENYFKFNLFVE